MSTKKAHTAAAPSSYLPADATGGDLGSMVATKAAGRVSVVTAGVASPRSVAAFFLHLAQNEDEPDYVTHLRLQKLMYYGQAWSLATRGRALFSGRIEAWAHGPVVRELYPELAKFGNQPIPVEALSDAVDLSKEDREFIGSVWDAYKGFTAFALRQMTHNETPWIVARGDAAPADACNTEITHEAMAAYFSQLNT